MFKKNKSMLPAAALMIVLTLVLLLPVVFASRYAYPWSDDFSYGADARDMFVRTGSVIKTIGAALKSAAATYVEWQGTYTSCFLMALQPAVWNVKLYHLTGSMILGTILLAYLLLSYAVLNRVLKFSAASSVTIGFMIFIFSVENIRGIAEGLTWYNSAIHYTFNHAWFWILIAFLSLHLSKAGNKSISKSKSIVSTVLLCALALLVAGGNNVTVLGGLLFLIVLLFVIWVCQKFFSPDRAGDLSIFYAALPVVISFFAGSLINFLAPGNRERMGAAGLEEGQNSPVLTIIHSFGVGYMEVVKRFSWELFAVLLIVAAITWYSFAVEKCLDEISFSFPLPGLIVLASYCLLSAFNAPCLFVGDEKVGLDLLYYQVSDLYRVENIIYFNMILFLVIDLVYFLGWLYKKKGQSGHDKQISLGVSAAAVLILVVAVLLKLQDPNAGYVTKVAIDDLRNGSAQYYGYQMAENTNRLMSDDEDVLVMPFGVNPGCLYPYEAEDWIMGTRLFYNKNSVTYESEPYLFTR